MIMFSLNGKTALVTGASRGIGRGIALALAKAGADVAVNYRSNEKEAMKVVEKIKSMGRKSFAIKADVSSRPDVEVMFKEVKKNFGRLDILVNNAGIARFNPIEKVTDDEWDSVLNTNLKGQFMCVQEAIKIMPKGGRILNISSIASGGNGIGFGNIPHYVAAKGGVIGMTEDLAIELGKKGINVNSIAPGIIDTDMTEGMTTGDASKPLLARIPKGRFGKSEDIGNAAVFLASDEADYITGVTLYVDGGWLTG